MRVKGTEGQIDTQCSTLPTLRKTAQIAILISLSVCATSSMHIAQARSQAKIPEGAKPLAMKSTMQGNNDGEVLYLKYRACKAKHQRVQWDSRTMQ